MLLQEGELANAVSAEAGNGADEDPAADSEEKGAAAGVPAPTAVARARGKSTNWQAEAAGGGVTCHTLLLSEAVVLRPSPPTVPREPALCALCAEFPSAPSQPL